MKKIAVISDVHGNYWALKKAIEDAKEKGIETFFFGGDFITDGFMNNEILDIIKSLSNYIVIGNREEDIINYDVKKDTWLKYKQYTNLLYAHNDLKEDNLKYLKSLPKYLLIEIEGVKFCLTHSLPSDTVGELFDSNFKNLDDIIKDYKFDIYVFGHLHRYIYQKYKNIELINPGSIGLPADGTSFTYCIITIDNHKCSFEKIKIEIDLNQIKSGYLNSNYYTQCYEWANLLLKGFETGHSEIVSFINLAFKIMKEKNISGPNIPNDIWDSAFKIWQNLNKN